MNHIELLKALKTILRPHTYLEVGIAAGDTLFSRPLPEFIIAIDPEPSFTANSFSMMTAIRSFLLFKTTSDEAFERLQNEQLLGNRKLDMSFVDGLHHAEVALRDIANWIVFAIRSSSR